MAEERIVVKLVLDTSGYKKGAGEASSATDKITKSASKSDKATQGLTSQMKKMGIAVAGAFAVKKVLDFGVAVINSASDLVESQNAVNVVFEDGADIVLEYGETAAESVGLAASKFNELATNTGALLTNFGLTQREAAQESINLTERAADLASVFNTEVEDALFAVQAALRGETEPIRRFGVSLDDATVKAKAVELGLAATTAEVDKNAKATAALALIYEQTDKVQGDFLNTSEGFANSMRRIQAKVEDAKAVLGSALIPTIEDLLPLVERGVGLVSKWAIDFGVLTGAIEPFVAAVRKAKIDLAASEDDFKVFGKTLDDIRNKINRPSGFKGFLSDVLLDEELFRGTFAEALDAIVDSGTGLLDFFDITGLELDKMTESSSHSAEAIRVLADEFGITEAEAADLIARLIEEREALKEATKATGDFNLMRQVGNLLLHDGVEVTKRAATATKLYARRVGEAKKGALDFAKAQRDVTKAFLEAANPAFRAISAIDRARDAEKELNDLRAEGKSDTLEAALAEAALAEARIEAQEALNLFDARGPAEAIDTIAAALDISDEAARRLLVTLGILEEGFVVPVVIDIPHVFQDDPTKFFRMIEGETFSGFAGGGSVRAGEAVIVGERGPEIFVPDSNGQIRPDTQLTTTGEAVSGGDQNITFVTSDDLIEDAQLVSLMLANRSLVRGGLRGGAF